MEIYTGESIARQFEIMGVGVDFVDLEITPQNINYYFNLKNILQLNKAKRYTTNLSVLMRQTASFLQTDKSDFCISLPRPERAKINFIDYMAELQNKPQSSILLGIDQNNAPVIETMDDLTHLLVAGVTGSGKSVALNNIIMSIALFNDVEKVGLILIDCKRVEFSIYSNLAILQTPIITTPKSAKSCLIALYLKMNERYKQMEQLGIRKNEGQFKKLIVIIDELSDLVLQDKYIKNILTMLLQKARACGIHFIVATQSPRASVLSGQLLANLPSRLALTTSSTRESILILGHGGAEKLQGKGDAILKTPKNIHETRVQVPYISEKEIEELKGI